MKIPDKHITLTSSNDIAEICDPLFKSCDVTAVDYAMIFNDGTSFAFSSKNGLIKHFYEKEYEFILPAAPARKDSEKNLLFWLESSTVSPQKWQPTIQDFRFDIDHALVMAEKFPKGYETFYFYGQSNNSSIINFYLNNIDVLSKFKFLFRDKAKKLIKLACKQKVITPKDMGPSLLLPCSNDINFINSQSTFKSKKYFFDEMSYLTHAELIALTPIAMGCSIKEAAKLTGLSPRTVESYFNHAKLRLGCQKKSDLIRLLLKFKLV